MSHAWQLGGLSLGWVTVLWLTPILSEADHRLNRAAPWVEQRLHTLRRGTGQRVHRLALSNDRLAAVLEALSDHPRWQTCEGALTQPLLRVYDLQPERMRLDSTTASGYWSVTEAGLFQFGHSKDHRPDLPQVKVMLSVLEPRGLPVDTDVIAGQRADDPLSLPAIPRVRERLGRRGLLYVSDCKTGVVETRASLQAGGDFYLCPLSEIQRPPAVFEGYWGPIDRGQQPFPRITRLTAPGQRQHLADGYERLQPWTAEMADRSRYLVKRDIGRLKRRPLSLTPMDLERHDQVTGLIRLLSVGLRVLTLLEFGVRQRWTSQGHRWRGCMPGTRSGQQPAPQSSAC